VGYGSANHPIPHCKLDCLERGEGCRAGALAEAGFSSIAWSRCSLIARSSFSALHQNPDPTIFVRLARDPAQDGQVDGGDVF